MIWLLAAETGNKILNDSAYVRRMTSSSRAPLLREFCQLGFLEPWTSASDSPANAEDDSRNAREGFSTVSRLEEKREDFPPAPARGGRRKSSRKKRPKLSPIEKAELWIERGLHHEIPESELAHVIEDEFKIGVGDELGRLVALAREMYRPGLAD